MKLGEDYIYVRCVRCATMVRLERPAIPEDFKPTVTEPVPFEVTAFEAVRDGARYEHPQGQCPSEIERAAVEELGRHTYRATITIHRDDDEEPMIRVGSEVRGMNFDEVDEELGTTLNANWQKAREMGRAADG